MAPIGCVPKTVQKTGQIQTEKCTKSARRGETAESAEIGGGGKMTPLFAKRLKIADSAVVSRKGIEICEVALSQGRYQHITM
jgi:hypothetical protein